MVVYICIYNIRACNEALMVPDNPSLDDSRMYCIDSNIHFPQLLIDSIIHLYEKPGAHIYTNYTHNILLLLFHYTSLNSYIYDVPLSALQVPLRAIY